MFHVVGNDIAVVILEMEPHNGVDGEDLPPPPPIPPNVVPTKADSDRSSPPKKAAKPKRVQAQRPGVARRGQQIPLYANHFKVSVRSTDDYFYHYSVCIILCYHTFIFFGYSSVAKIVSNLVEPVVKTGFLEV